MSKKKAHKKKPTGPKEQVPNKKQQAQSFYKPWTITKKIWGSILGIVAIYGLWVLLIPDVQPIFDNSIFENVPFKMPIKFENKSYLFPVRNLRYSLDSVIIDFSIGGGVNSRIITTSDNLIETIPPRQNRIKELGHIFAKYGFKNAHFNLIFDYKWFLFSEHEKIPLTLAKDEKTDKYQWQSR